MSDVIVGIDVGKKGAIAVLISGTAPSVLPFPWHQENGADAARLAWILRGAVGLGSVAVYAETQAPFAGAGRSIGASSAMTIGRTVGVIDGVVAALSRLGASITLEWVDPRVWQSILPASTLEAPKRGSMSQSEKAAWVETRRADAKARSMAFAAEWSGHSLRFPRSRVQQDGIADALNIARWGQLKKDQK